MQSVGRNELHSPEPSPRSSPDPAIAELLRSQIRNKYEFKNVHVTAEDIQERAEASEDETELILFAAPPNTQQSHRIRLSSPDAATGEPGLSVKKPREYYFADDVTSEKEEVLSAVALTGEEVLQISKIPWPGCALPWKVHTIPPAGMKKAVLIGHNPALVTVEEVEHKRRHKGKKSRIALRKKAHAAKEKNEEQARVALEKEENEREKRTRRNREKKVKRKAREKAKKEGEGDTENPLPNSQQGLTEESDSFTLINPERARYIAVTGTSCP
jgi:hypothetical protein